MSERREREFDIRLPVAGNTIRVRMTTRRAALITYTAQYETWIDDRFRPVVRYDNAHGRPHRDLLDWEGNVVDKRWEPEGTPPKQALERAINDLRTHWESYREAFRRMKL